MLRVGDPEVLTVPVRVRGQGEDLGLLRAAEVVEGVVVAHRPLLVRRDAGRAEDLRDVEDAVDDVPAALSVAVVEPSVHCRVLVGQVEGMRVPEEDALGWCGGPHARGEVDVRLGLLRAADLGVVEEPTRQLGAVPDAGERLLHLAPADAAPARREVGRLADLTVLLPPGAGPGAERRVVDLRDGAEEQVQDEVVALRILPEGLRVPEEVAERIRELGRHLVREVEVGREAELVLAVRRELPGRHDELVALVGGRRVERSGGDRHHGWQAGVQDGLRPCHRPGFGRGRIDPLAQHLELVLAQRGGVVRHRGEEDLDARRKVIG